MEEPTRPDVSQLLVQLLRSLHDWEQAELAAKMGVDPSTIWRYEHGTVTLQPKAKERLAAATNLPLSLVEAVLVPALEAGRGASAPFDDETFADVERAGAELGGTLAGAGRAAVALLLAALEAADLDPWERTGPPAAADRLEAADAWERLETCTAEERQFLVETCREFQTWALAERLCHESEKAASDRPEEALELAELACRMAELARGDAFFLLRLKGYTLAFLANARRVTEGPRAAEGDFTFAVNFWHTGAAPDPDLLAEWRLLDLEASLRRSLRQFAEALALHARALAAAPPEAHGRILLKKAATYEQQGEAESAIDTLREAAALVDGEREPRLRFALRFNLTAALVDLERYAEADSLLPEVKDLSAAQRNEIDQIRVVWLSGKIAAGLGRTEEARDAFEQVRRDFTAREMAYDCALVSLDLAKLHLEQGRNADVRALAEEMLWIFKAQGIEREALAALRMFCEAARKEAATVDLARRAGEALGRGRRGTGR
ncbi:MAG TPA: helix-turn-helix transcriptional regulator [Thermoanaerobaculia bacterium]|jgi:transcriptional regulator with XRE-family HTH domain|nr:helix-turn-helix transcriptional regulator [Thermoanaerobaculia bacterium]